MSGSMSQMAQAQSVRIRKWTEEQFATSVDAWQQLLSRSSADPLFMSWDWQWRWWQCHKSILGAELVMLAAYGPDDTLVALAPCYASPAQHKAGIKARRLQLIGSAWRSDRAVFSEYLDVIVAREAASAALPLLARALAAEHWDDFVFANVRPQSTAAQLASEYLGKGAYVRVTDALEAHATVIEGSFEEYLQRLNAGARRKVWNHRKKLQQPELSFAGEGEVGAFLDRIDALHRARWGVPHYVGIRRAFHQDFAASMARQGALRMSILSHAGTPISVLYNIRLGGAEYNLQSGFDAAAVSGVSPGYLHLGYCLEGAFADRLRLFDFLAGEGRNRQYKADFNTQSSVIETRQVVRSATLRLLYRTYDAVGAWRARREKAAEAEKQ